MIFTNYVLMHCYIYRDLIVLRDLSWRYTCVIHGRSTPVLPTHSWMPQDNDLPGLVLRAACLHVPHQQQSRSWYRNPVFAQRRCNVDRFPFVCRTPLGDRVHRDYDRPTLEHEKSTHLRQFVQLVD